MLNIKNALSINSARLSLVSFLIFIFCSCATVGKYEAILDSWMGYDINSLMNSWVPPSDQYSMPNGNNIYTWLCVGNTLVASNYNKYLNLTLTNSVTYWCKTTFTDGQLWKNYQLAI